MPGAIREDGERAGRRTAARGPSVVLDAVRRRLVGGLIGIAVATSLAGLALLLLTAWFAGGAEGWGAGSRGPLLLLGSAAILWSALLGALHLFRMRWVTEARVAASIDGAAGLAEGSVHGAVQLERAAPRGISGALARQAATLTGSRLSGTPATLSGGMGRRLGRWLARSWMALGAALAGVVALWVISPERARANWSGLVHPIRAARPVALPPLALSPGDVEVPRGAPLDIEISAEGREVVTLHWRAAGEVPYSHTDSVRDGAVRSTLPAIDAATEYWAESPDGAVTPRYRATPVDPLLVTDVTVEVLHPAHTGLPPVLYESDPPSLIVPAGSRLRFQGTASRDLSRVELLSARERETAIELAVSGSGFSGTWTPGRGGSYRWRIEDERGRAPELPPASLDLTLVADSAPAVRITYPGRDTVLTASLRQALVIEVRDDYGIETVELETVVVSASGARGEPSIRRVAAGGVRGAVVRPLIELADQGLLPGDEVRYRARATDNHPSAQVGESREFVLRMPGLGELRAEAQSRLEQAADEVEALAQEAETLARDLREAERATASEARSPERAGRQGGRERVGFEERESIRSTLEREASLLARTDSLAGALGELQEELRDAGVTDPELRRALEELEGLLERLGDEELAETVRALQEQLSAMEPEELQEALSRMTESQEEVRDRLAESLERFRRAAVEEDFRAATEEARELAQEERLIAEALREERGDQEELARRQEEAARDARALQERLERLESRLDEMGEDESRNQVAGARERTAEAAESAQQGAEQANQGRREEAASSAQAAGDELQAALEQLQEAQAQRDAEAQEALRAALAQASQDALALASRQSEVRDQLGSRSRDSEELRGEEGALLEGTMALARNLAIAQQIGGGDLRAVFEEVGRAAAAMERAISAMGGTPGGSPQPALASASDALNRAAIAAIAAAESQGGAATGAAQEQLLEALEQMAQEQARLNQASNALLPMQQGRSGESQQMSELAQGQQRIASDLGDLADQAGPAQQNLGDLQTMAEEAREIAEQIAGGRLEPETVDRQRRLFQRLLDAGRSLEREEESDERESETARPSPEQELVPLPDELVRGFRYLLPDPGVLRSLPPAQRQLVLEYFERLNRTAPPPTGGRGSGGGGR